MHKIISGGKVTGMKLNVDDSAELKKPLKIKSDAGSIQFNPDGEGRKIIFGGKTKDDQAAG